MKTLTAKEFSEYIAKNDPRYLYNPICEVAFKDVGYGKKGELFCKGKGLQEFKIDRMDEDFELAMMMKQVMSEKEYNDF